MQDMKTPERPRFLATAFQLHPESHKNLQQTNGEMTQIFKLDHVQRQVTQNSSDSDQETERSLKLSTAPTATLKPTRTGRKSLFRPSCTSQPPPKKKPPNPKPRKTAQQTQQKKDTHHTPTKKHHTQ